MFLDRKSPFLLNHGKSITGWWCVLTILKNDGVRQWEGWHPIYEMEDLKHVPNHQAAYDKSKKYRHGVHSYVSRTSHPSRTVDGKSIDFPGIFQPWHQSLLHLPLVTHEYPLVNQHNWLVGGIPTPLKNMSSSVGMMTFPIYGNKWSKPPTR